ncbi:hypothetical protein OHA98_16760 [Streptomyces sp. NBC_00654]|nr:hypothetical protein [Streptomyces sp. NBC_00654]MCX4966456.1 hypothetical protein [Streptomyces sp. NBC_00654]
MTDSGQDAALHVRRGVLEAADGIPADADLVIEVAEPVVMAMTFRDLSGA